ncbi:MAG: hypothetical protein HKN76_22485 [Saprospiraceae bacterium]|nr:hypothetical protein [Saprospiraceae bacterium]
MFYNILRQITATLFKVYFRKIYLIDLEKVPLQGPILIACNHPMAFTEACLLACFLDRPLHFLVRGDVFKSNWEWFFRWTNQIPIYRFRDGFSNMRRNSESFSKAHEALAQQKAVLIFAEGNTKLQKKLSPLQKGTARLAFGAYDELNVANIKIVPVGVNYTAGKVFRSDVAIKIGTPLHLEDYLELYKTDHHEAFRKLTDDLYNNMLPLIIHIEDSSMEPLADRIFHLYESLRDYKSWPILDYADDRFKEEKKIARQINSISQDRTQALKKIVSNAEIEESVSVRWSKVFLLFVGLPIFIGGFILNAAPFYLAKSIAFKKVSKDEFLTPVRLGLIMVLYIVWMVIWFLILIPIFGWYSLIALCLLPLTAYVVILWKEGFDTITKEKRIKSEYLAQINEILYR